MPLHDYECTKCGIIFESDKSTTAEKGTADCPKCGGQATKIMSTVNYYVKGRGWIYSHDAGKAVPREQHEVNKHR